MKKIKRYIRRGNAVDGGGAQNALAAMGKIILNLVGRIQQLEREKSDLKARITELENDLENECEQDARAWEQMFNS